MYLTHELDHILAKLGMNPLGDRQEFAWLKEAIMIAVWWPNTWRVCYLERIGEWEGITRERVRQVLYKVVWDHWTPQSVHILSEHFGRPIQTQFKRVKPTHIEFITLLSEELLKEYPRLPV